jgi:hypothetical protein
MLVSFRKLKAIDDKDEEQESLHCLRQMITRLMMDDSKNMKELARVAKNSSTRAYAGHSQEMRHIFAVQNLNLTEYARSFGLYKSVHDTMPKSHFGRKEHSVKKFGKMKNRVKKEDENNPPVNESQQLFTKRL